HYFAESGKRTHFQMQFNGRYFALGLQQFIFGRFLIQIFFQKRYICIFAVPHDRENSINSTVDEKNHQRSLPKMV
ncbi:hypothetical protein, partial [Winogradskyella poriferorum]|uniref:hypothetical protein n=1 Tax=Winogradskyella poriferorum TaxID=307627 RepID=UPI003D65C0BE